MPNTITVYELTPQKDFNRLSHLSGFERHELEANLNWFLVHIEWNIKHKWIMVPPRTFAWWSEKQEVPITFAD